MKTFTSLLLLLSVVILFAASAFAAPTKLSFQNLSAAGQTNYPVTCSVVGILDKTDIINDNAERLNLTSLRSISLSKGGLGNYSTALTTKGSNFKIACVRTNDGTATTLKMYFDSMSGYWFPVSAGIYRFY
jgi:hypothetical protein